MAEIHKLPTVSAQHTAITALKLGFPITCATCEHFKFAWDTDAESCGKTITCGGPVFGRGFPDYKGPLTSQTLEHICLICAKEDVDYLVLGGLRRFGLCFTHHQSFDHVNSPGTQRPMVVRAHNRLV